MGWRGWVGGGRGLVSVARSVLCCSLVPERHVPGQCAPRSVCTGNHLTATALAVLGTLDDAGQVQDLKLGTAHLQHTWNPHTVPATRIQRQPTP